MAVKLFVGGLSFSTSTERLREVFAACGAVGRPCGPDRDTVSRAASASRNGDARRGGNRVSKLNGTPRWPHHQVEKAKPGTAARRRRGAVVVVAASVVAVVAALRRRRRWWQPGAAVEAADAVVAAHTATLARSARR